MQQSTFSIFGAGRADHRFPLHARKQTLLLVGLLLGLSELACSPMEPGEGGLPPRTSTDSTVRVNPGSRWLTTLVGETLDLDGDLVIAAGEHLVVHDSQLLLRGNLEVHGTLTLLRSSIEFDTDREALTIFTAYPESTLDIRESRLASARPCRNWDRPGGRPQHTACKNWGLTVHTGAYTIIDSDVSGHGLTLPGPSDEAMSYWDPYDARFTSDEGGLILGNTFHECGAVNCLHFITEGGGEVEARGARIENNVFEGDLLCCLSIWGGQEVSISGNLCAGDLGIFSEDPVDVRFSRNTFVDSTYSGCALCLDASGVEISDNTFTYGSESAFPILDNSVHKPNSLSWSDLRGEVRWPDRSGLTISGSVSLGDKIQIEHGRIAVDRHPALSNLDGMIQLTFRDLACPERPRLYRDEVACAELEGCSVTEWLGETGMLIARVDGRGVYEARCPSP